MQIAIVGAGFAGLAAAYYFSDHDVTLFDTAGIGSGASGTAPGLLHPYGGAKGRKAPDSDAGMEATRKLLDAASEALGSPVYNADGIIRVPQTPEQEAFFRETATHPDVTLLTEQECQEALPGSTATAGIFISSGITVDSQKYLEGLLKASEAKLIIRNITSLEELREYDQIIVAAGALATALVDCPIHPIKGQALRLAWPKDLPPPRCSVIGAKYLVMSGDSCLVGGTYEREFSSPDPDLATAKELLIPEISRLYPQLATAEILDCTAGLRAAPPDRRTPILKKIDDKTTLLTGFGSKGLLYHALYASRVRSNR